MAEGALGAAGVRRIWAGAGLQRAAYKGGCILRGFPHSLLQLVKLLWIVTVERWLPQKVCYSRTVAISCIYQDVCQSYTSFYLIIYYTNN